MSENPSFPTVSVIIPVFNGEKYLRQTIESALSQTHRPYEVLVIDDASEDSSPSIIASFGAHITSSRLNRNQGVAAALNHGIRMATGDIVAFLDHDDIWFKDKLKHQVEFLESYPEAGFNVCNYIHRVSGRLVRHYSKLHFTDQLESDKPLLNEPVLACAEPFMGTMSAVAVRRNILQNILPLNTCYKISVDDDCCFRSGLLTKFSVITETLFYKRIHNSNLSSDLLRTWTEYVEYLEAFIEHNQAKLHERGIERSLKKRLVMHYFMLGDLCARKNKPKEMLRIYGKAFHYHLELWFGIVSFCKAILRPYLLRSRRRIKLAPL